MKKIKDRKSYKRKLKRRRDRKQSKKKIAYSKMTIKMINNNKTIQFLRIKIKTKINNV